MSSLEFNNLNYWVKSKSTGDDLHILKNVSGSITPGRFHAFLGSSGSGKTTLLDCIAQRKEEGKWCGTITYKGKNISTLGKSWRKCCGYVLQHDRLLSISTVFETLMFSSQLRGGYNKSYAEHVESVENILEELSLSHRKDSFIGAEGKKVLSGGEIRRVSIGQELVANVEVLLLDEPTSGLDSSSARQIVELLKSVAKSKNRIVAATIHQPSSDITQLFDDMMLLAFGEVCFNGQYSNLVSHFESIGKSIPLYVNPTDYIMDLSQDRDNIKLMVSSNLSKTKNLQMQPNEVVEDKEEGTNEDEVSLLTDSPFWFQFKLLWIRGLKQWYRDEIMLISESVQYIFCGLFVGAMYYQFSSNFETGLFDRFSALFFVTTTVCFIPSFTVVTMYGTDAPLLKREISGGMYSLRAQFIAKIAITWPFEIILTILFSLCSYFLCGFQYDAIKFLEFTLILILFVFISETIGLLSAALTKNSTIGVLLLSIILLVCLALGGFLVSETKPAWEWFEHINFFSYAFAALQLSQFEGLTLYQTNGTAISDLVPKLKAMGRIRSNLTMWQNIGVLLGMLFVLRMSCYIAQSYKLTNKRRKMKYQNPNKTHAEIDIKIETK